MANCPGAEHRKLDHPWVSHFIAKFSIVRESVRLRQVKPVRSASLQALCQRVLPDSILQIAVVRRIVGLNSVVVHHDPNAASMSSRGRRRVSRRACRKKRAWRLAVEFPSPCDGSASAPPLRLRGVGTGRTSYPPEGMQSLPPDSPQKDWGPPLASYREPQQEAEPQPELDIQSQNGIYIFGPSDSIRRSLTLGESRYQPWASCCVCLARIPDALTIWRR
jgi:hypothetical protein